MRSLIVFLSFTLMFTMVASQAALHFMEAIKSYRKTGKHIVIKNVPSTPGLEFSEISRGTLLKILGAFEEYLYSRMSRQKQKVKPMFHATFINNRHTYPFIYPQFYKSPHVDDNMLI